MILFDCDGVLLDSEVIADRILCESLSTLLKTEQHHSEMSDPLFLKQWIIDHCGQTDENILQRFSEFTRVNPPHDFLSHFQTTLFKTLSHEVKPIPGMKKLLESLEDKWAVASNSSLKRLKISLKQGGLINLCESRLFSSEQVGKAKPAPDLHLHIAEQYDVVPNECLVIEDSAAGVKAGLKAGMRVIGFIGGSHITPKHIDFLKMAGPEKLINNSDELSDFLTTWK